MKYNESCVQTSVLRVDSKHPVVHMTSGLDPGGPMRMML
jgi:hypothetical protein